MIIVGMSYLPFAVESLQHTHRVLVCRLFTILRLKLDYKNTQVSGKKTDVGI